MKKKVTMKYFDKEHPTKINYEKLRKLLHKNHIPGQIYLNKGLPCEFKVPEKKAKKKKKSTGT